MDEEKVLFKVSKYGSQSKVDLACDNGDEVFSVALAIIQLFEECPELHSMCSEIYESLKDPEFRKAVDQNRVTIPNFNDLLKN